MIIFEYSTHFLKSRKKFLKNQPKLAEATIKTIALFCQDPYSSEPTFRKVEE
jgi:hypothetical protein